MKHCFIVASLLMLCSCASSNFSKEGVTPTQQAADQKACQHEAQLATAGMPPTLVSGDIRRSNLVASCMEEKGYTAQ